MAERRLRRLRLAIARRWRGWRGDGDAPIAAARSRRVYLTFDDGPDPVWTPRVLDELGRLGLRATFFVIGERAARHPEPLRRALREGHEVELHCMRHVGHGLYDREELEEDTRRAIEVLGRLGARPRRWRPPNAVAGWWTEEVAARHGLRLTGASVGPARLERRGRR